MFALTDISLRFLDRKIFDKVSWHVPDGERVGIVGANGSGKTTLLKIIAGLQEPDSGRIERPKGSSFGYMPQQVYEALKLTLWDEVMGVFRDVIALREEMASLEHEIAVKGKASEGIEPLLGRYSFCQGRFEQLDGFEVETKAASVLMGLGFEEGDFNRNSSEFSGGWQMRILLAKLLLERPDVLLLDEPTNYLDLEARQWLEQYLANYSGSVVIVSHDRYFLDRMVTSISEVGFGKLEIYRGDYSNYEKEREQRRELLQKRYRHQQEHIAHVEAFIERFRYKASKAKSVQGRIKYLERLERIELPQETHTFRFDFPMPERGGKEVVRIKQLKKSYPGKEVFDGIDLTVYREERVAVVGVNGAGKTTLLKLIAGREAATGGSIELGYNIKLEYFSQDQDTDLSPESTVLEEMESVAPLHLIPRLRGILGSFLFSGDDVLKKVKVLSGGERSRLLLAKMMFRRANLLVLDEPTNHLDIAAKQIFEDALRRFPGTVIIVSHDRRLMINVATKVLEVEGGRITSYLGNYDDYVRAKAMSDLASEDSSEDGASARVGASRAAAEDTPHPQSKEGKRLRREREQERATIQTQADELKRKAAELEAEIAAAEERKTELDRTIAEASSKRGGSPSRLLVAERRGIVKRLPKQYKQWEALLKKEQELKCALSELSE